MLCTMLKIAATPVALNKKPEFFTTRWINSFPKRRLNNPPIFPVSDSDIYAFRCW
jgi:hypothetical protein